MFTISVAPVFSAFSPSINAKYCIFRAGFSGPELWTASVDFVHRQNELVAINRKSDFVLATSTREFFDAKLLAQMNSNLSN